MIKRAKDTFKHIAPCPTRENFDNCFTVEENNIYFWFNTEDQSTHVLSEKIG